MISVLLLFLFFLLLPGIPGSAGLLVPAILFGLVAQAPPDTWLAEQPSWVQEQVIKQAIEPLFSEPRT